MNPITSLFTYLLFSISILFSNNLLILLIHVVFILILFVIKREYWFQWKSLTNTYWKFLPIFGITFFLISIILLDDKLDIIFYKIISSILRMSGIITIMTFYIIQSKSQSIFFAIRSIWYSSKLNFHWIDKMILFFELTIRFFPTVQEHWVITERSQNALSFHRGTQGFIKKIIQNAKMIPDFIIINLHNVDRIVDNMKMRGYGKIARRSTYPFLRFGYKDIFIFIFFSLIIFGVHSVE